MATRYSARWCWEGKDSESVALFSADVPQEVLVDFVDSLWANAASWQAGEGEDLRWVDCIDMETGEVIAERSDWDEPGVLDDYAEECMEHANDCDDDCGFDPYLGCYTDDC